MFQFVNHLIIKTEKIEKGTFCPNSKQNQMIIIYSINVQAVCYYRYCFLDVAEKKPGSVHDSRMFLNSSINKKLRNLETPKCEKNFGGRIRSDTCPFNWRPCLPSISARATIKNAFVRLKARLRCLDRATDIDINTLPQVIISWFIF